MSAVITPLKVAGIVAPIMRPLPTIFTYARLTTQSHGKSAQALDEEYRANLQALAAIIEQLCQDAGIARDDWQGIIDHLDAISDLAGGELAAGLDKLCADLTELHRVHGKDLKSRAATDPDRYHQLYCQLAPPKKLLICYSDGRTEQADSLERKLADRCYYEYEAVHENWRATRTGSADLVVFAPSARPIPASTLSAVESYGMPLLILMGGNKADDQENMALLKSEYLYRKSGYNVLHSPFTPARLYSTIDAIYLRHLAGKLMPLPEVAKQAAAQATDERNAAEG
jgi:hypothetical protein